MGYTRYKTLIMNYLQFFFTNKWHKGHHRITPNSGRPIKMCLSITMSFLLLQIIPTLIIICKLFSRVSKLIHALLASKRCLIDLQKVPFKPLTNALLESNKASFLTCFYNRLISCWLQICFLCVFLSLFTDVLPENM